MEAFQEQVIKRDSFEEVDRILAIVEESKKDFDKRDIFYKFLELSLYLGLLVLIFAYAYSVLYGKNMGIEKYFMGSSVGLFGLLQLVFVLRTRRKLKNDYMLTSKQATEVIREIFPVLSRSDNWSALQKFELRLRLSRLGISTDKIFGPEF
jgi:hypothetical protein